MSSWKFPDFPLGTIPPLPSVKNPASSFFNKSRNDTTSAPRHHSPTDLSNGLNSDEDRECDNIDPRNILRPSQARKEKTSEEKLLHSMVRDFLVEEGLYIPTNDLATGAVPRCAANPSAVAAYMSRVGQGPLQEHPSFSWEHPVSHAWNKAVIRMLDQKFRTYVTDKGLSKLIRLLGSSVSTGSTGISIADINQALDKVGHVEKLVQEKLEYQQGLLRRAQRKIHSLRGQTEVEVEDHLKCDLKTGRTKARRQERKRNLYLRRAAIIDENLRRQDPELWDQIHLVFAHFNEDGMSSDETEIEKGFGAPKLLRRVRKLWINPDVTQIFHYIDDHYNPRTVTGTLKKGSAPLKRERISHVCNALAFPKPNLPINFYDSTAIGEDRIKTLDPQPEVDLPTIAQMDVEL